MFEETLNLILNNTKLRPCDEDSLLGVDYDISHAFDVSDVFDVIEIKQTSDRACMFDIRLSVSDSVQNFEYLNDELLKRLEFVGYAHFSAISSEDNHKSRITRWVSVSNLDDYYVTAKVTISGSVYERLVKLECE